MNLLVIDSAEGELLAQDPFFPRLRARPFIASLAAAFLSEQLSFLAMVPKNLAIFAILGF